MSALPYAHGSRLLLVAGGSRVVRRRVPVTVVRGSTASPGLSLSSRSGRRTVHGGVVWADSPAGQYCLVPAQRWGLVSAAALRPGAAWTGRSPHTPLLVRHMSGAAQPVDHDEGDKEDAVVLDAKLSKTQKTLAAIKKAKKEQGDPEAPPPPSSPPPATPRQQGGPSASAGESATAQPASAKGEQAAGGAAPEADTAAQLVQHARWTPAWAWHKVKEEVAHYAAGFRLLGLDIRVAAGLLWRSLNGNALSRRERRQFIRTLGDIFRLVPFSVFIIVPGAELLLPFAVKLFPGLLPSTFQGQKDKDAAALAQLKVKMSMAKFLHETLEDMAVTHAKRTEVPSNISELLSFLQNTKTLAENPEQIRKFARHFKDDVTLDNMERPQLAALCKILGLQAIGTSTFLRFQLRVKLREIKADDLVITKEGLDNLTTLELQVASRERGMRAIGVSEAALREQLGQWIDLHVKEGVPSVLLLFSKAMALPEDLPEQERILSVIESLPASVRAEIQVEALESEALPVDTRQRLAVIATEQEMIRREREEEESRTAQEAEQARLAQEAEAAEHETMEASKFDKEQPAFPDTDKVIEEPVAVAPEASAPAPEQAAAAAGDVLASEEAKEGKTVEERISLEDFVDIAVAVVAMSDADADKKQIEELREEIDDHNLDVQELLETTHGDVIAPSASKHLSKRVKRMVSALEKNISQIQTGDVCMLDRDNDGFVTTDELVAAMRSMKRPPSEKKMKRIAAALDADADGVLSLAVINKVLGLAQEEGEDIKPQDLSLLVALVEKESQAQDEAKEAGTPGK